MLQILVIFARILSQTPRNVNPPNISLPTGLQNLTDTLKNTHSSYKYPQGT